MVRNIVVALFFIIPLNLFGETDEFDTISVKPIGVNYSKYSGVDKLYLVGECDGKKGNQIIVFQNRPSFDFFENNEAYKAEQKDLEQAIWAEILDNDSEPIIVKGIWHEYNERMVFLCHQILKMNSESQPNP